MIKITEINHSNNYLLRRDLAASNNSSSHTKSSSSSKSFEEIFDDVAASYTPSAPAPVSSESDTAFCNDGKLLSYLASYIVTPIIVKGEEEKTKKQS